LAAGIVRVGISGWTYAPWRGFFYPKGLRSERELAYAAGQFRTIEINDTFYSLQRPEAFAGWAEQVAAGFLFAVKAPRVITHVRRLGDAQVPLANFIASGLLRLNWHLGPILWQFPMNFRFDADRIAPFLKLLPHDTDAAIRLGRRHDATLRAPACLYVETHRRIRHAFEIGHESFRCQAFIDLLRAHDVALVCNDSPRRPRLMDITSDFVYCRLNGPIGDGTELYDAVSMDAWARRINIWAAGGEPKDAERVGGTVRSRKRDVFVCFDHAKKLRGPDNAMELTRRLRW
jgi:uncharacterized protein YecE (DUF72 family)